MYPFSSPKSANGDTARKVQGANGKSKPMNKVAAPSRNSATVAMKLASSKQSRSRPL
jgi:hypothetical protein